MDNGEQQEYVRQVLDAYRRTPGTLGTVRSPDRLLAAQLYERGIDATVIENALLLAAARRLFRDDAASPLAPIRSFAYFRPVIEEVLTLNVGREYFEHLRRKIARLRRG